MLEVISWFLFILFAYIVSCYLFRIISSSEKISLNYKNILLIIIAVILNCYLKFNYGFGVRALSISLELILVLQLLYKKGLVKTTLSVLALLSIYSINIVAYILISEYLFSTHIQFLTNWYDILFGEIIILSISSFILTRKKVVKCIYKIISTYKGNTIFETILLVIITCINLGTLIFPVSSDSYSQAETFVYTYFFFICIIYVLYFRQSAKSMDDNLTYNDLLKYIKEYEKELNDNYEKSHEYKNQLVVIKGLTKNKKATEYIDNVLNEPEEDNTRLLKSLETIPSVGLKGLIYFKLNNLGEDVEVHINASSDLKNEILWDTCKDYLKDVSKVVGVFLDNAVEALEEEKEKYLVIDIDYEDDCLVFAFSNTCTKKIDFKRLGTTGYTTKGKKHGIGLSLVRKIVDDNYYLNIERQINGKFFVSKLLIKSR